MHLSRDECELFYNLYPTLLCFVNKKLNISKERFENVEDCQSIHPETLMAIRDALFAHRELIDEFVKENPAQLSADALKIVASWKHAVVGKFYIFRYLTDYTVFLTLGDPPHKAFGVLGLDNPLKGIFGPGLPKPVSAVLLPFKDKIVCDGLVAGQNINFDSDIKKMLNEDYKKAQEAFGIITSLPIEGEK